MERKKKLKIILEYALLGAFLLFAGLCVAHLFYWKNLGNSLSASLLTEEGGLLYIYGRGLRFQVGENYQASVLAVGLFAYLGFVIFVLCLTMSLCKRVYHQAVNSVTALLAFESAAITLGGFLHADEIANAPTAGLREFLLAVTLVSTFFGVAAVCFAMLFTLGVTKEVKVETVPDRVAKDEVIIKPSTPVEATPVEETKPIAETKKVEKSAEPTPIVEKKPEQQSKPSVVKKSVKVRPTPAKVAEADIGDEPKTVKQTQKAVEASDESAKVPGKYELFQEAGFWKYRLKANNGEILIVSMGYKTKASALNGIETLKKHMPTASTRIVVDKNGFGQFRISSANDARLIATGEIYPNEKGASNALASVLKFYETDKIVPIKELPENEVREWEANLPKIEKASNGKVQIMNQDGKFLGKLIANNGETLFVTSTYSSRKALLAAIENLKDKIGTARITIARDKQNRYQFRVFSDNGMLLVVGETYPTKDGAISSATSMRNFLPKAKVID